MHENKLTELRKSEECIQWQVAYELDVWHYQHLQKRK